MKWKLLKDIGQGFKPTGEVFESANPQEYLEMRMARDGRSYSCEPAKSGIIAVMQQTWDKVKGIFR